MSNFGTFTFLRPLSLVRHLSSCCESTILQVSSNSVSWLIYLEQGKITYATHSVEPFDRLERHLRRLSYQIPSLKGEARVQLRLMFEPDLQSQSIESILDQLPPEYQAICWLVSERYLRSLQASLLIQEMVKEVMESFLLIKQGTYKLNDAPQILPVICRLDVEKIVERCQERLQAWASLSTKITSPYQRPYLWIQTKAKPQNLPEIQQSLAYWMKGFSLRHLAVIINQDEVQLARNLYPYIQNGTILLHEPDPPFDKLPKTHDPEVLNTVGSSTTIQTNITIPTENIAIQPQIAVREKQELTTQSNTSSEPPQANSATVTATQVYKIVSVDDSPTILKEISRFLEAENFSVVTVSDPLKAVMTIIRHKPDLILLDLNMDGIDGYELCRIIKNNSMFKNTPILMVTGNKGIVDKVKARLVGASGYLTKPFTQADLLKIVFMHLT